MSSEFKVSTHCKCIIAGEHAVLRGHPALLLPVKQKTLQLRYVANSEPLSGDFSGQFAEDLHLSFWSVLEHALKKRDKNLSNLTGKFFLHNQIPLGAGLGGSGALCAAITKWLVWQSWLEQDHCYRFARELEDLFHGQSSGVDVLGALSDKPFCYQMSGETDYFDFAWQPKWYLSCSDQIGITAHCVKKVTSLWQSNPDLAAAIDNKMADSVALAKAALQADGANCLTQLADAINQAADCFAQWGLIGGELEQHIKALRTAGALAAKPTGSGAGGYILSLWANQPPQSWLEKMIPLGE